MRVWKSEAEYDLGASVVALGMFDGVHIGHQALIARAQALAKELDAACVVHSFDRHPLALIAPERMPRQLLTLEERIRKIAALGVDGLLLQSFTWEFADTAAEDFLRSLAARLHVRGIVAGFNYSFGAGGRGDAALLCAMADELGYRAEILDPVIAEGGIVSSSRIRALQDGGEREQAERLMALRQR